MYTIKPKAGFQGGNQTIEISDGYSRGPIYFRMTADTGSSIGIWLSDAEIDELVVALLYEREENNVRSRVR